MPSPIERALSQNKHFSALSSDEKARLLTLAVQLSWDVGRWAACSPLMRAKRIPQLALTLAAASPTSAPPSGLQEWMHARGLLGYSNFLSLLCFLGWLKVMRGLCALGLLRPPSLKQGGGGLRSTLVPCIRMGCWLFAIDDLLDEGRDEDFPALNVRLQRSLELLEGQAVPGVEEDPLLRAMQDMIDELGRFALFASLRPYLARTLRKLVETMVTEREWSLKDQRSEKQTPPSLEEYLSNGRYSVGVYPVLLCALITLEDASVASEPAMARIDAMEREAGTCVRLANDLRSYEREVLEGKLNSITLLKRELMREQGLEEAVAVQRAQEVLGARIQSGLNQCLELSNTERTASGRPERFLTNLASFACDFYSHHDYHHSIARQHG